MTVLDGMLKLMDDDFEEGLRYPTLWLLWLSQLKEAGLDVVLLQPLWHWLRARGAYDIQEDDEDVIPRVHTSELCMDALRFIRTKWVKQLQIKARTGELGRQTRKELCVILRHIGNVRINQLPKSKDKVLKEVRQQLGLSQMNMYWTEMVLENRLNECSIEELREYCKENRIKTSGKAKNLMDRIQNHVLNRNNNHQQHGQHPKSKTSNARHAPHKDDRDDYYEM